MCISHIYVFFQLSIINIIIGRKKKCWFFSGLFFHFTRSFLLVLVEYCCMISCFQPIFGAWGMIWYNRIIMFCCWCGFLCTNKMRWRTFFCHYSVLFKHSNGGIPCYTIKCEWLKLRNKTSINGTIHRLVRYTKIHIILQSEIRLRVLQQIDKRTRLKFNYWRAHLNNFQ